MPSNLSSKQVVNMISLNLYKIKELESYFDKMKKENIQRMDVLEENLKEMKKENSQLKNENRELKKDF